MSPAVDADAIKIIRGLAMDAPFHANSGHQGTAMSLAPVAHVLYSRVMKHNPADPKWPDRDRFVLSNGHASILQYALLYLNGYGLELDDLRAFRQWESATPGHPEAGHTAGVEVTTGPLGQGFANAVGMAIAERFLRDRFGADLVDHRTWVLAGDGCLMEGVSHEAASLAGHLGLGHLNVIFDDNRITIDGGTELTCSDDVARRFEAYGWHVAELGELGDDLDALEAGLLAAKAVDDRPSLLILRTRIGTPSPRWTDVHEAHGNPFTATDITATKELLGIPDEPFWAPAETVAAYRTASTARAADAYTRWQTALAAQSPADRQRWDAAWAGTGVPGWEVKLPTFEAGTSLATRQAIAKVIAAVFDDFPGLVSGAADLTGNTGTKLPGAAVVQSAATPGGQQVYFGIREHAMGSALVGMAAHGGVLPIGGTFFAFYDYMRPPVRLAALSHMKAIFVFTHDSVGVGEDGPTHQPIEQLAGLRTVPELQVIRPADANETAAAWLAAVEHHGPTALVLSRQNLPVVTDGSAVARGGGIVRPFTAGTAGDVSAGDVGTAGDVSAETGGDSADGGARVVLVATGSEVSVALAAAEQLAADGIAAQVVSLPSWDRLAAQPRAYRDELFPPGVPVVSVEAGTTFGWERFADATVGIDRFGASAPGAEVLDRLGINPTNVAAVAKRLLAG